MPDLGALASLIAALSGLVLGGWSLLRQRRTDEDVSEAKAQATTAAQRTVAIQELETAVTHLGALVDRANRRATACEEREVIYLDRLARQEEALASQGRRLAILERGAR